MRTDKPLRSKGILGVSEALRADEILRSWELGDVSLTVALHKATKRLIDKVLRAGRIVRAIELLKVRDVLRTSDALRVNTVVASRIGKGVVDAAR